MYLAHLALVLAFCISNFTLLVNAGIFVIEPASGSTCHGGQSCTVEWLDDGIRPLLTAAGICTLGLYTGDLKLVQALPPVDVSGTHSITFKPNPAAGPNSDSYYIAITSTTFRLNSSTPYTGFSPFFRLDQMTGSFDTPLPEATSTIPIPPSLSHEATSHSTVLSTITVGILSTSLPPLPTPTNTTPVTTQSPSSSSQTRLSTSILPSSPSVPSTSTTVAPTLSSNSALENVPSLLVFVMAFILLLASQLDIP